MLRIHIKLKKFCTSKESILNMSREKVIQMLQTKFSERVAKAYEAQIFNMSEDTDYEGVAYEKVGELLSSEKDERRKMTT